MYVLETCVGLASKGTTRGRGRRGSAGGRTGVDAIIGADELIYIGSYILPERGQRLDFDQAEVGCCPRRDQGRRSMGVKRRALIELRADVIGGLALRGQEDLGMDIHQGLAYHHEPFLLRQEAYTGLLQLDLHIGVELTRGEPSAFYGRV